MRPYMRAANVTWDGISTDDVKEMNFTPNEFATYGLRKGDILLSEASGSATEVGKPAIWQDQIPGACFQNTLIRVRAPGELVPYLYWHFRHDALTGRFAEASKGIGIHHLGREMLAKWCVQLPPLAEQRRIVAKIEELTTRSRAARAALAEVPALLEQFRQSVLASAFRGDLTADWRAKHPDAEPAAVLLDRIRDERRKQWEAKYPKKKYVEPQPVDDTDLPELPEGWCWAMFDEIAENFDGIRIPVKLSDRNARQGEYPYYGASGIIGSIDAYLFDGEYLLIAEDGANLLSRNTPIAFQAHGRFQGRRTTWP